MNGAINYTLGLTTSPFLGGLRGALAGLAGLAGTAIGLGAVMRGVWSAIEEGGALQDLSARTGESVSSLYQLRAAFAEVGASAENLPILLLNLQRALGGADEAGQSTSEAFSKLGITRAPQSDIKVGGSGAAGDAAAKVKGLSDQMSSLSDKRVKISLGDFKALDAAKQVEILASRLSQLDKTDASTVASKLFGRGFGDIKMIISDFEGFQKVLRETAEDAKFVARSAAAFDQLGDTFAKLKRRFGLIFTGIAEALAPTLQWVLDAVNKIDFGGIGQGLGAALNGVIASFQAGTLAVVISEAITVGIQSAMDVIPGMFGVIGSALLKAFETPLLYLQAGLDFVVQTLWQKAAQVGELVGKGKDHIVAFFTGAPPPKEGSSNSEEVKWEDVLKKRLEEGLKFDFGSGEFGPTEGLNLSADALAKGAEKAAERMVEFAKKMAAIGQSFLPTTEPPKKPGDPEVKTPNLKGSPDVDSLTKIGFFSGGQSAGTDHARQTARNTASMVTEIRELRKQLKAAKTTSEPSFVHA